MKAHPAFTVGSAGYFPHCTNLAVINFSCKKSCLLLLWLLGTYGAQAQSTPFFLDATPADTTVACQNGLPPADSLRAVVSADDDGVLDTVTVGPINTFAVTSDFCAGSIFRIWVVSDQTGTARDTQMIAYRDTIAPTFLLPADTTVTCTNPPPTPAITGELSQITDNCSPVDSLSVTYTDTISADTTCTNCQSIQRTWSVVDECGNEATGVQTIRVADTIAPTARCSLGVVEVDPAGTAPAVIDPTDFDAGSDDNCGIATYSTSLTSVSCSQIGQTLPITLTVADSSGNRSTCSTSLVVNGATPQPSAGPMVCGGDTLRLFANPPTPTIDGVSPYAYRWFGPLNSLISTEENPVFPQINQSADGAYRVEIRGITGCTTENVVNVVIGDVPAAPSLTVPSEVICIDDPVSITSPSSYAGTVIFRWFRGTPAASVELDTTVTGFFSTELEAGATMGTFYAVVEVDGCQSPPSDLVIVRAVPQPIITVAATEVVVCQNEDVALTALGDPTLTYRWTGPTGVIFTGSTLSFEAVQPAAAGLYTVVAFSDESCQSEPVDVALTVIPAPAPVAIEGPSEVCPGADFDLTASDPSGDGYEFTGPSGQVIFSSNPTITLTAANASVAGAWSARVLVGDCFSPVGPPLLISLLPSVEATASISPDPVCEGNDLQLVATDIGVGASYAWSGPSAFVASGRTPIIPNVGRDASGEYNLIATNPDGCQDEAAVQVNVRRGIVINEIVAEGNECLAPGDAVRLTADVTPNLGPSAYEYTWRAPDGTLSNSPELVLPNVSEANNGLYRLIVENAIGCFSPQADLNLELNFAPPSPPQPTNADGDYDYCLGGSLELMTEGSAPGAVYLWSGPGGFRAETTVPSLTIAGITADAAGAYTVAVRLAGCVSLPSAPRNVTVTTPPSVMASVSNPICEGAPINFTATDLPSVDYLWVGPAGFTAATPDPTIPVADSQRNNGNYFLIASRNGCAASAITLPVAIQALPARPSIDAVSPVCADLDNAAISLFIPPAARTDGASYTFSFAPGGSVTSGTTPNLTLDDLSLFNGATTTSVTATADVAGCASEASAAVTIRLDRTFGRVASAGPDTSVCPGQTFLRATEPPNIAGRWTRVPGNGSIDFVDPTDPNTPVTGLTAADGPYQFVWTLSNGSCVNFSADTVTLAVTQTEAARAGDNRVACIGTEITLAAEPPTEPGSTGRWTQRQTQAIIGVAITNPSNPNTPVTGLRSGTVYTFTWEVASRCGTASDEIAVSVSDPTPRAGANQRICSEAASATVQAVAPSVGSTGEWYSPNGTLSLSNPAGPATNVEGLLPGENQLVWELDGGVCGDRSRDTLLIRYLLPPRPADDLVQIPFQGSADFNPAENDDNPFDATLVFGGFNPNRGSLENNGNGTYTFVAPDNFVGDITGSYVVMTQGCEDARATVRFVVGEDASCDIPNIFTPNNDGVNDNFVVPCLLDGDAFPSSEVTIYNQWGDEVFRSATPYRNDWSGTFQGGDLPVGTYFYLVNRGDGTPTMTGNVRIER